MQELDPELLAATITIDNLRSQVATLERALRYVMAVQRDAVNVAAIEAHRALEKVAP